MIDKKRVFDLSVAIPVAAVLALPVLFAAAAIAVTDRQPPVFTQIRLGKDRKPFKIYKLRTMLGSDAEMGAANYGRVTPLGHFLRSTAIDELPQIINVLKGDMSLVGPRPLRFRISDAAYRYEVKPGITGLTQINDIPFPAERSRYLLMDREYLTQFSTHGLRADVQIIFHTIAFLALGRKKAHYNRNDVSAAKREHLRL